MVNGFLELTAYFARWVCAIFENFAPIVDGLVKAVGYDWCKQGVVMASIRLVALS